MEEKKQRFCQSCGMPLTDEVLGINADGSKNEDYCVYCYQNGAFTSDCSMEEMADYCSQFVEQYNKSMGANMTAEEYKGLLLKFFPTLKRWKNSNNQMPNAEQPIKEELISEINALGIEELHVDNLFVLQGSFINQPYNINGNVVKLFDDNAYYWGNQIEKADGRCYGIACDEKYIVVSEYGEGGEDARLVLFKSYR